MRRLLTYSPALSMMLVLLTAASLSGCAASSQARLNGAARIGAEAGLVPEALAAAQLPEYPPDCRRWQPSGVVEGDRLDAALLKTDQALTQANLRVRRCATWYDGLKPDE